MRVREYIDIVSFLITTGIILGLLLAGVQAQVITPPAPLFILEGGALDGEWLTFTVRVASHHDWIGVDAPISLEVDDPLEVMGEDGLTRIVVPNETVRITLEPLAFYYEIPLKTPPPSETLVLPKYYACGINKLNRHLFINTEVISEGEVHSTHRVIADSAWSQYGTWKVEVARGNDTVASHAFQDDAYDDVWVLDDIAIVSHEGLLMGSKTEPHVDMASLIFGEHAVYDGEALRYLRWDHEVVYMRVHPMPWQRLDWFHLYQAEGAHGYGSMLVGNLRAVLANKPYAHEAYKLLSPQVSERYFPVAFTDGSFGVDIVSGYGGWVEFDAGLDTLRMPVDHEYLPSLTGYLDRASLRGNVADTWLTGYDWFINDNYLIAPAALGTTGGSALATVMVNTEVADMLIYNPHLPNGTITDMGWVNGSDIGEQAQGWATIRQDSRSRSTIYIDASTNLDHSMVNSIPPVTLDPQESVNVTFTVTNLGVENDTEGLVLLDTGTSTASLPFTLLARWEEGDITYPDDRDGTKTIPVDPPPENLWNYIFAGIGLSLVGVLWYRRPRR